MSVSSLFGCRAKKTDSGIVNDSFGNIFNMDVPVNIYIYPLLPHISVMVLCNGHLFKPGIVRHIGCMLINESFMVECLDAN